MIKISWVTNYDLSCLKLPIWRWNVVKTSSRHLSHRSSIPQHLPPGAWAWGCFLSSSCFSSPPTSPLCKPSSAVVPTSLHRLEKQAWSPEFTPKRYPTTLCLGQGPPFHPYPGSLHPLACCWEPSMLWQCRSQPSKWANLKPKAKPSSGPDHPAQRQAPVSRNSPRPRDEMEARGREVCKPASANPARRNSSNLY